MSKCKTCKEKFKVIYTGQICCCETCLVAHWDNLPRKERTRKNGRLYSGTLGYKSMSEVKYSAFLNAHGIKAEYETTTFKYQHKPQKYTPDFKIAVGPGKRPIYLEYKGKFTAKDRRKILAVRLSNPNLDLRLVFERSSNKLSRVSQTTYARWAEKHNIKWYDRDDLNGIMNDVYNKQLTKED